MKVSYPVKVAVKKTAFIALFSGMVLSAGAQNTNLITEEEPDIKVTKDTESGTEPVIRVMVEAETESLCEKYVDQVIDVIKSKGHTA